MRYLVIFLWAFFPLVILGKPTEAEVQQYAYQMQKSFELQATGKTLHAFYLFRDAYQTALAKGESLAKLTTIETLFIWYRKFGYSSGVLPQPSGCIDEYLSPYRYKKASNNFDPSQEKMTRDFLCGVGCMIGGVFCIVINPSVTGRFGPPLIMAGFKYMYDSVSAMICDMEERKVRVRELDAITQRAIKASE